MTDRPVDLDEHRGMAAQKSTELRRRLHEVQVDQAALRQRQDEFEFTSNPVTYFPVTLTLKFSCCLCTCI
jgi:hypothetical protein